MEIDRMKETVSYNEKSISWYDENLMQFLKTVASYYGKKPSKWTWEMKTDSYASGHVKQLHILEQIWHYWRELSNEHYKNLVRVEDGYLNISDTSSKCLESLIYDVRKFKFKGIRPLKIPKFLEYLEKDVHKKNGYMESFYDVHAIAGTNNWSENVEFYNLLKQYNSVGKNS
jgi:hypothetical protein